MEIVSVPAMLAVFAGLCFALQAIAVEKGANRAHGAITGSVTLLAAFVSVVVSMVLFWLIVVVRGGMTQQITPLAILIFAVLGVGYPAVFRLLYFRGIEEVGPSIAAATITANPVVAAILATIFLGEWLTIPVIVGTLLIVGGGMLLQHAYNSIRVSDAAGMDSPGRTEMDVLARKLATADAEDLLALVGAMFIVGASYVLISYGLSVFPDAVTATAIAQTSGVITLGAYMLVMDRETLAETFANDTLTSPYMALFVLAGIFVALAWLGQFFALGMGTVTTVVPLIYVYPLFLVAYAYASARQYPRSYRIVAAILVIVVGATLVEIY